MPTSDELLAEMKRLHPQLIDLSLGRIERLLANAAQTRQILAKTAIDVQLAGACVSSSDGHPLRMALNSVGETGERLSAADIHDHGYIVIDTIEDIEQKWPLIEASQSDIVKIIMVHSEREERREQPEFYGINGVKAKKREKS